jgi:hypothetical protein
MGRPQEAAAAMKWDWSAIWFYVSLAWFVLLATTIGLWFFLH